MEDRQTGASGWGRERVFAVAWTFLLVVAVLGVTLRALVLWPVDGVRYAYVLHAHSHLGFLGWVFNAFVAVAWWQFAGRVTDRFFRRLFVVLQVANVGMLASFPVQGYGPVSIAFSTLHMTGSAVFAWRLWRRGEAAPLVRPWLRAALVFMLISGLGPLTLGPLAAMDLRESPWYAMSIYFYLHFQYNGWFVFFVLAAWMQMSGVHPAVDAGRVRLAWWGLAVGCVGSFALSALWMEPPGWVFVVALGGGVAQVLGLAVWLREFAGGTRRFGDRPGRWLAVLALAMLAVKMVLQVVGAVPVAAALVNERFVVIGFLHLVFLGVVTPLLIAWAREAGWMPRGWRTSLGIAAFLLGAGWTLVVLFGVPVALVPGGAALSMLLAAAVVMLVGVAVAFPVRPVRGG